jgi:hypothetical protein
MDNILRERWRPVYKYAISTRLGVLGCLFIYTYLDDMLALYRAFTIMLKGPVQNVSTLGEGMYYDDKIIRKLPPRPPEAQRLDEWESHRDEMESHINQMVSAFRSGWRSTWRGDVLSRVLSLQAHKDRLVYAHRISDPRTSAIRLATLDPPFQPGFWKPAQRVFREEAFELRILRPAFDPRIAANPDVLWVNIYKDIFPLHYGQMRESRVTRPRIARELSDIGSQRFSKLNWKAAES